MRAAYSLGIRYVAALRGSDKNAIRFAFVWENRLEMKAQRAFGIGRGAGLLKNYDHERLLGASCDVLGSPRGSLGGPSKSPEVLGTAYEAPRHRGFKTKAGCSLGIRYAAALRGSDKNAIRFAFVWENLLEMKAQRPFGIGRGARLLKKYDHERLLRASWEVLGNPRRSQEVPRVPGRSWGLHTRHLGTDGLRPKPHVSPDADASVPMPAFSTLAELARYRARLPIAREMEDAAIQIAVNDRIAGAEEEAQRLAKLLSDPPGYRGEASVSHPQDRPYFFGDAQGRVTL